MGSYTTFTLTLPDEQVAFIKVQAAQRGVTVSDVLASLVQQAMRTAAHQVTTAQCGQKEQL